MDGRTTVNGAASRYTRLASAIRPSDGAIDSRSLVELLHFAPQFGALLDFYGLDDRPSGDWSEFFASDPTMVLAAIASVDPRQLDGRFVALREAVATQAVAGELEGARGSVDELVSFVVTGARALDHWVRTLARSSQLRGAELVSAQLHAAIRGELGRNFRALAALDRASGRSDAPTLNLETFAGTWALAPVGPDLNSLEGASPRESLERTTRIVGEAYDSLALAIGQARRAAVRSLESTLEGGEHRPQIALYQAFAVLFRRAQAAINSLAERYPEFYYREVLRMRPLGAEADRTYLTFTLSDEPGLSQTSLPANTLFSAGDDEQGSEIIYGSDLGLTVTSASLAALRTLRTLHATELQLPHDAPRRAPADAAAPVEPPPLSPFPTQLLASTVDLAALADDDPSTTGRRTGFATFGPEAPGETAFETTRVAEIGFALASPDLALGGGQRHIELVFHYGESTAQRERIAAIAAAAGVDASQVLLSVLESCLRLRLSTSEGWREVPSYEVDSPTSVSPAQAVPDAPAFCVAFTLPASFPAIAAHSDEDDGDDTGIDTDTDTDQETPTSSDEPIAAVLPTLSARIDQSPIPVGSLPAVYPLTVLEGLSVHSVRASFTVDGLTDLSLENSDGDIDPSVPFPLFGSAVSVGSYLRIKSRELFDRRIGSLSLTIDWFDLPSDATGFAGYYRDYTIGPDGQVSPTPLFTNQSFTVSLAQSVAWPWTFYSDDDPAKRPEPTDTLDDLYLFRTRPGADQPCDDDGPPTADGLLCDTTGLKPTVGPGAKRPGYYDPDDNALELRLTAPAYAFGDSLYSANVLASVVSFLPDCIDCTSACEARYLPLKLAGQGIAECMSAGPSCTCLLSNFALVLTALLECLSRGGSSDGAALRAGEQLKQALAAYRAARQSGEGAATAAGHMRSAMNLLRASLAASSACMPLLEGLELMLPCMLSCAKAEDDPEPCTSASAKLLELYAASVVNCVQACSEQPRELAYPNAPYLPQARAVRVHYTAKALLFGGSPSERGGLFQLLPFAGYQRLDANPSEPPTLLPSFPSGSLYLGFDGLPECSPLSLLFRMASDGGSARDIQAVSWQHLTDTGWRPIEPAAVTRDGTHGLRSTGIVQLRSVAELGASTPVPGPPRGLRASTPSQVEPYPQTLSLTPHALLASCRGTADDPLDRYQPVEPHTITTGLEDLPFIASIDQPMASFGGRAAQREADFWLAAGERLRHKDRALLSWDDERLVLERYPWVWKVCALPAQGLRQRGRPGEVLVVVVPMPSGNEAQDPTVPAATPEQLASVAEALRARATPFATIRAVNPNYLRLKVVAKLVFEDEGDASGYAAQLDRELVAYLSPWFYDAERAAKGGDYVEPDEIEAFISSRPYVRWVVDMSLETSPGPGHDERADWCFLTSAEGHSITAVDDPIDACMPGS